MRRSDAATPALTRKDLADRLALINPNRMNAVSAVKWVGLIWLLSSCISLPGRRDAFEGLPHLDLWPVVLSAPIVLTGDSPHYLVMVNSLIEDADLDLANNYDQARRGGLGMGVRFRGVEIDRHVESDRRGRQLSFHPPFMPMALAALVWPLRGSMWVEPACVWLTMLMTLSGVWMFAARLAPQDARWTLMLALATPLWCYSRDLWTGLWAATCWAGLLAFSRPKPQFLFALAGTLMRYPFALVPACLALLALWRKEYRRAAALAAGCGLALLVALAVTQFLFQDSDHFSLFHMGYHIPPPHADKAPFVLAPLRFRPDGLIGLLFHPRFGLLPFFPALAWGLWQFRKGGDRYLPALALYLLFASYSGWSAGTGFSARYMVPMLPVLTLAAAEANPQGRLFRLAVLYSFAWGAFSGFFPALAYDQTPWGLLEWIYSRLTGAG